MSRSILICPTRRPRSRLGGTACAAGVAPGRVLHLRGDLGAGKTTLVRGLLRALGSRPGQESRPIPWLNLIRLSSLNLYHFDFYRFKDRAEWLNSGFREYFNADSVCIVEWPERAGDLLSPPDLAIRLEFDGAGRRASWTLAHSAGVGLAVLAGACFDSQRPGASPVQPHLARARLHPPYARDRRRSSSTRIFSVKDPERLVLELETGESPRARRAARQGHAPTIPTSRGCAWRATGPASCAWCST